MIEKAAVLTFISLLFSFTPAYTMETVPSQPTGFELVKIQGDCFRQGSDHAGYMEKPRHETCLSDFFIGRYEVTQRDWRDVMGSRPSYFSNCGENCPVDSVSWNDIREFIRRLNAITGRAFRLPTEAEWEFACTDRGSIEAWCGGNTPEGRAWTRENSSMKPHPVGQKQPNTLGIFDMSGNNWEWVEDWSSRYENLRQKNPKGPQAGSTKVRRGGSWQYPSEKASSVWRSSGYPDDRAIDIGFRLAHPATENSK